MKQYILSIPVEVSDALSMPVLKTLKTHLFNLAKFIYIGQFVCNLFVKLCLNLPIVSNWCVKWASNTVYLCTEYTVYYLLSMSMSIYIVHYRTVTLDSFARVCLCQQCESSLTSSCSTYWQFSPWRATEC